ncbi:phosphatidylinositol phosphate phosphatase activity protein [[Candida] boidinii]|nr:phosphatidylinositol phosphate phosphatase activity protein [[Candida] boidinii]OWB72415.1 phosphatidylinositol phosphate phosphatase activity protein [[Candida] boidinii]
MRILLNTHNGKRTLAIESETHCLLFMFIKNLKKCAIELVDKKNFNRNHYEELSKRKITGFLGLIEMNQDVFLCVITGSIDVASPSKNEKINKIMDVEFYCLTKDSWDFILLNSNGYPAFENNDDSYDDQQQIPGQDLPGQQGQQGQGQGQGQGQRYEQNPCFELKKLLSDGSFYYSNDFDLTSTLQGRGVNSNNSMSLDRFHLDYMWNSFMMEEIINYRNNLDTDSKYILSDNKFLTTVIRGFAETLHTSIGEEQVNLTIISKQSWKRAGTRFNVRGVDDDGNVANFVETELIYDDRRYLFAFSQIRGSIPVFWEQDTALISPKVQIKRSFDATQPIFEKHFQNLNNKYGPVHIVNLLSTKPNEKLLSNCYKDHFIDLNDKKPDTVILTEFDFHSETSKTYAHAERIIKLLDASFHDFGYFLYDKSSSTVLKEQQGIFRTNCLDCLDRTNVVQQVISIAAVTSFLIEFKGNRRQQDYDLRNKHSTLWADHGDQISQIYTGTNALKSSFSRSGKMNLAGALSDVTKSVSRIYINNFVDKGKQVIIDTLLGKNSSQTCVLIFDPISDYVNDELKKYSNNFTKIDDLSIFIGSFNLAGGNNISNGNLNNMRNSNSYDLSKWLFPIANGGAKSQPDIMILGFQEVVELTASNILNNDGVKAKYWEDLIQKQLDNTCSNKYVLLRSEYLSSILLFLFVDSSKMGKITQVEGKTKKTGLGGMTANKGSVSIRFDYGITSFCFVNSHLAAGAINVEERYGDIVSTWNGLRFSRNRLIEDHNNIIWLGDLNYRIPKPNEEVRSLIKQRNLDTLLRYDQLSSEMKRREELRGFKEMKINFIPTYKFDKGTSDYDSSEKQRVPSWTDRIIYKGNSIEQLAYDSINEITFSDHKPIYGLFNGSAKLINHDIKSKLTKKFYSQYKSSKKIGLIELNDPDDDDINNNSSSETSSILIPELSSMSSSPAPPALPQRRQVPPAYDPSALLPGFANNSSSRDSDSSIEPISPRKSSNVPLHPVVPLPRRPPPPSATPPPGFSMSVMQPSRSLNGTPVSTPPPPPPRRPVATSSTSTDDSIDYSIPASKFSASGKLAPMVPIKPKNLSSAAVHSNENTTPVTSSTTNINSSPTAPPTKNITPTWTTMVPNKKL